MLSRPGLLEVAGMVVDQLVPALASASITGSCTQQATGTQLTAGHGCGPVAAALLAAVGSAATADCPCL
jgi:hypothetical protein